MRDLISALEGHEGARLHAGLKSDELSELEDQLELRLPKDLRELLLYSNGADLCNGYVRLFGARPDEGIDVFRWNEPEYWKFAWRERATKYFCFGQSAWGDQYAYAFDDLQGRESAPIYTLSIFDMTRQGSAAGNLTDFLDRVMRMHANPDWWAKQQRMAYPVVPLGKHLVYCPPFQFLPPSGRYDINNVMLMDAIPAMICAGDMAREVEEAGEIVAIGSYRKYEGEELDLRRLKRDGIKIARSFEVYEDDRGRTRLRIVWD